MKPLSGNIIRKFQTVSIFALFLVINSYGGGFSVIISSSKQCYFEEEKILLKVEMHNDSSAETQMNFDYLEPLEKNTIFVPSDFKLEVRNRGKSIPNFINWMPPEPAPGIKSVTLKPGETIFFNLPFTWYYYPVDLPAEFSLKLFYGDTGSNPLSLKILPTPGRKENDNLLVNGDFSQGDAFPFGWVMDNEKVSRASDGSIVFSMDRDTAEGEGVWLYSIFYPVKSPSSWTLSLQAKASGQEIMVFVEGWGIVAGRRRRIERNECFFHPKEEYTPRVIFQNPEVRWLRLKLFAYLIPGKVVFRKISLCPSALP